MSIYNTREHRVTPETDCVFESTSNQNLRRSRTENFWGKSHRMIHLEKGNLMIPARIKMGLLLASEDI
jgi:hypothetical protein